MGGRFGERVSSAAGIATVIRSARADDAARLAAAERQIARVPGRLASLPTEIGEASFRAKIEELATLQRGTFAVVEVGGVVVGHGSLDPLRLATTAHVVMLSMAIHEGFQGRGLGRMLLDHLCEWATAHRAVEKIELHVRSSNPIAIALYQRCGFQEEGRKRRRVKYREGYVDDVMMGKWVGT